MFNKKLFAELLSKARGNRSINQYGLHSNVDAGYISRLSRELIESPPSPEILKKLADHAYGDVAYEDFMAASGYLEASSPFHDAISLGKIVRLPIYGDIRAGEPILAQNQIVGYEYALTDEVKGADYFYLRVRGDSMIGARIYPGDLVLVRRQDILEDGQIGVVMVKGEEATLKRVYFRDGQFLLAPENPAYKPKLYEAKDVRVVGEVVEVKFKINGRK